MFGQIPSWEWFPKHPSRSRTTETLRKPWTSNVWNSNNLCLSTIVIIFSWNDLNQTEKNNDFHKFVLKHEISLISSGKTYIFLSIKRTVNIHRIDNEHNRHHSALLFWIYKSIKVLWKKINRFQIKNALKMKKYKLLNILKSAPNIYIFPSNCWNAMTWKDSADFKNIEVSIYLL